LQRYSGASEYQRGINRGPETETKRKDEHKIARHHLNMLETGIAQGPVHTLLGSKCEGTGIFRSQLRQLGDVLIDGLQRGHHPRILARLPPAGEYEPPRRQQRAM